MTREERHAKRQRYSATVAGCGIAFLGILLVYGSIKTEKEAAQVTENVNEPKTQAVLLSNDIPETYRPAQEAGAAELLAKTAWGEARGCSTTEQAAVMWCVLNRVDAPGFPDSVYEVVTAQGQFVGYDFDNPVTDKLLALAEDVLARWSIEEVCTGEIGRVLPKEYLYFTGDGNENRFTDQWQSGVVYDWHLPSPYEE